MLNLILVEFEDGPAKLVQSVAAGFEKLNIVKVNDPSSLLAATERGHTAAVVFWLDCEPSEGKLELIQRLTLLKIPCLTVVSDNLPDRVRLNLLDNGFMGIVRARVIETRLRPLLDMFVSRATLLSADVDRKVEQLQEMGLLFDSPEIKELLARLGRVASLGSTILLTGETGVGKSTIARWIHSESARQDAPFVDVPCAALPSNLIESELFGHMRGSFTSADRDHVGKFKVAGRGTLLLDEVDCLPLEVQGKLLRAVERREFERVGSNLTEKFEARLVVATNRPLEQEVAEGRFRSDLYYRLGVLSFRVPALRERAGAVRPLAEMFVQRFAQEHQRPVSGFTTAAMHALESYNWPGNLRELRNAVEYSVAVCSGREVQWSDVPESVRDHGPRVSFPGAAIAGTSIAGATVVSLTADITTGSTEQGICSSLPLAQSAAPAGLVFGNNSLTQVRGQAERELVMATLRKHGNNRSKAAAELGISRVTLYKRLERLGIQSIYAS